MGNSPNRRDFLQRNAVIVAAGSALLPEILPAVPLPSDHREGATSTNIIAASEPQNKRAFAGPGAAEELKRLSELPSESSPKWLEWWKTNFLRVDFDMLMCGIGGTSRVRGAVPIRQLRGDALPVWLYRRTRGSRRRGVTKDCTSLGYQYQHSLTFKAMRNSTRNFPYDGELPIGEHLSDEVSPKQEGLLKQQYAYILAHGGAFSYIDDMNWSGRISDKKYERMKKINAWASERFSYLGGVLVGDVAAYVSQESNVYPPKTHHFCWNTHRGDAERARRHRRVYTGDDSGEYSPWGCSPHRRARDVLRVSPRSVQPDQHAKPWPAGKFDVHQHQHTRIYQRDQG